MAAGVAWCLLAAFVFLKVHCQSPAIPNEVAKETGICRYCKCENGKVDCVEQNITTFFGVDLWTDLKEYKPTHVDLSENYIKNITELAELPIEVLNLSRNRIEHIEDASFKNLQSMRVLDLSYNSLNFLLNPHAFEGRYSPEKYEPLGSLRVLNLAYNDFHALQSDFFEHMPDLTDLDLSGNPLTVLDRGTLIAISSLRMIKSLRLRSCQISEIPDKFLYTPPSLERLDLSGNKLTAVPQELGETKALVYLNLNQNPIVKLDVDSEDYPGFPRLKYLKELHMCNMDALRSIGPRALGGLMNLEALHMSFNSKLSYLDPKALARSDDIGEGFDWPPIKKLYLQSNNLSEVDSRLVARWDQVENLNVSDNPFLCDCSTQWMVDVLVPILEKRGGNASLLICQQPAEMRGYTMRHLHDAKTTMRCLDRYGRHPERDGAILMGTLIGVLLSVPIMLSLVLLWRRGYFACIGFRGPVDVSRAFYKKAPAEDFTY